MAWKGTTLSVEQKNNISNATKIAMQRPDIKEKQINGLIYAWKNPSSKFNNPSFKKDARDRLKRRRENGEVFGASGWNHSEESKKKISENQKRAYAEGRKKKVRMIGRDNPFYNKKHNEETLKKISGENSPRWKGGITKVNKKLRSSFAWKKWRNKVFERDNYVCQKEDCHYCKNKKGVELHPHHKKYLCIHPELAFDLNNGITYCKKYHQELHKEDKFL